MEIGKVDINMLKSRLILYKNLKNMKFLKGRKRIVITTKKDFKEWWDNSLSKIPFAINEQYLFNRWLMYKDVWWKDYLIYKLSNNL